MTVRGGRCSGRQRRQRRGFTLIELLVVIVVLGVLATLVWSGVLSWLLLKLADAIFGMRVAGDQETEGLDTVLHNEQGYNL